MDYRKLFDDYFSKEHARLVARQAELLKNKEITQYRHDYEVRRLDKWMRTMTTKYPLSALVSFYKAEAKEGRGPLVDIK